MRCILYNIAIAYYITLLLQIFFLFIAYYAIYRKNIYRSVRTAVYITYFSVE